MLSSFLLPLHNLSLFLEEQPNLAVGLYASIPVTVSCAHERHKRPLFHTRPLQLKPESFITGLQIIGFHTLESPEGGLKKQKQKQGAGLHPWNFWGEFI